MKKIITWIASFILASSTAPVISQLVSNTSFNHAFFSNHSKESEPIINVKQLNKHGNFYAFSDTMGVLSAIGDKEGDSACVYLVDNRGNLQEIRLNGKTIDYVVEFYRMSDTLGVLNIGTGSYFLNDKGEIISLTPKLPSQSYIRELYTFSDTLSIVKVSSWTDSKLYFFNNRGELLPLMHGSNQVKGEFYRMSNTLGFITDSNKKAWLLDISDPNVPKWKDLGIKNTFTRMSDTLAIVKENSYINGHNWLLDISDPNNLKWTDLESKQGDFYRFSDSLCIFEEFNFNLKKHTGLYFLNLAGQFKKINLKETNFQTFWFAQFSNTMGILTVNVSIGDDIKLNTYLLLDNGELISIPNQEKNGFFGFRRMSDTLGVLSSWDIKKSYFLSIIPNPDDIAGLKASVIFDRTVENQYLKEINRPDYQGEASNNNVYFHADNKHIKSVTLNGTPIEKKGNFVDVIISIENLTNKIIIENDLTSDLKYNIYIKKQATVNNIKNVAGHQLTNYVGVFDNQDFSKEKTPNLQDIIVSDSEVEIDFNTKFISDNKLYKIDNQGKKNEICNITNGFKLSTIDSYMLESKDLVTNINNQYLTIGIPTITDFRTTDQWKQAENWALKNGYRQGDLSKMNANEIKDLLSKYNPSPTPSPTPNPNNNIGWYIFLGVFLGLITFGIAGFYINKFVIKPIRNKRSDIKADKYVAEQMELSKKWKEQETKEKQAREKKKGGK
ncbi:hypothetical protein [Spiroplasma sp. AdecLV25b]|uniref:hypothetical protein n=1 Tax=Spiroplasma sp. AdecLV25b TaxID=3027162 RepID=UPI0027E181F1|nr:hypothetical protein [Spiroplasma sp. AdecLV25b]